MKLTRDDITSALLKLFEDEFEISNPGLDDDLRSEYGFDSIDGIELLREIETLLETELDRDEKENAMEIRTINQIIDYIEVLMKKRLP
jgi:acyl carrier protein